MIKKKFKNTKGFTLAELLIVVAIIAVLVAVSIPIFAKQLEKAREEVDAANWRAAKAAFVVALISDDELGELEELHYDAASGLVYNDSRVLGTNPKEAAGAVGILPYGHGTSNPGYDGSSFEFYDPGKDYTGAFIEAKYDAKAKTLTMYWIRGKTKISDYEGREVLSIKIE